ncbi:PocR ligand-binding domain-containing protein [Methanosarcina mazei]|uniref:Histidine kinase n=1 Tax=Methanosarcina mazei TaxID=2209 RepID=A0A0F8G6P8_METMZ|nr:PocR ligand-binding domain-containing protein [Methanosarcina mazei]KKG27945.1 histidine kinase [Methanosarcina mazei]KKG37479.1 histidine kinase [Methanosarcina mazei]KKG64090.1 histidine kinase [Methanosarcina mazei]KKG71316.1 histidine kinase [Methanosarcina mazei]KKH30650.1 histidine kinase [Methanosarcina mazei]
MKENLKNSGIDIKRVEETPDQSEQYFRQKLEDSLSPSQKVEDLELTEIINVHAIEPLMDNFYKLTNIPIGLNDLKGNVLIGVGWQDICTRFHRVHPETCKHCIASDIMLSSGVSPGKFKMYRCRNNMWDIVTPIMLGGHHIGNIFSGQFFFEDEPLDYELFRSQARKYGFNEEEYIAALDKVPRLSREAVNTGMAFLMGFANMLSELSYSNIRLSRALMERNNLVNELQKNREDLDRAQAVGNIGSWRLDVRKNELIWSDEAHRIFDIPKGTPLTYEFFLSTVYPDDREYVDQKWKEGLGRKPYDIEHRIVAGNKIKWVREKAYLEFDKNGGVTGGFGITQDITERKKVEEALRISNIYNRSLIEASPDPLVTIGQDGKITDVNYSTETVTGYSRDELIGTDFSDYFTEPERAKKGYQHVFLKGFVKDYPLEIQHKDGRVTQVLYNASVYRDESGEVIGVFAAARDVTELKKAEDALKKAHDNLEKLVEERTVQLGSAYESLKENEISLSEAQKMAHIGNWDWDLVTGKVRWSDELYSIFGRDPQKGAASYEELLNYVHPDDRDFVGGIIRNSLTGERYGIDYRIIRDNGEERTVHAEKEIIFDHNNTPVRSKGIIQDITERKKAEEALEKIQETHIKEIHHRIKNNLQVISSLLSLESEKFSDAKILESFRESQNRVASMALIHEELYKGNELDTLDFADYIKKLTSDLFDLYSLRNSGVSLKLDLEKIHLDMDTAIPLGIIVNELVSNSLKHAFPSGEAGEIHISFCKKERFSNYDISSSPCFYEKDSFHYILAVEDNGRGIPEEIDFANSDSLGLQLVNILVEQVGGCIDLKRGQGTKFTIWFRK